MSEDWNAPGPSSAIGEEPDLPLMAERRVPQSRAVAKRYRRPEPQCACFTVPEERWTRHYDVTEPGSMVEPNPDCPVHFPKADGSRPPTLLGWTVPNHLKAWVEGADIRVACMHFHAADTTTTSVPLGDDDAPTLVGHFLRDDAHGETVGYRPGSSSEVSSVSPEGETTPGEGEGGREELSGEWGLSDPKVELAKAIAETAAIPQWRAALAATFLIDEEGWRPPQPGSETEWRCAQCGADRWVGWRAGPQHEGFPRRAQCVPCGHVQDLPRKLLSGVELRSVEERDDAAGDVS